MAVTWGTYESFAGHLGCDRCHDGKHLNATKEPVPVDCDTCHVVLSFRQEDPTVLEKFGIELGSGDRSR